MLYFFLRSPQNLVAIRFERGKKRAGRCARQIGSSDPRETSQLNLPGLRARFFMITGHVPRLKHFLGPPWRWSGGAHGVPRIGAKRGGPPLSATVLQIQKPGGGGAPMPERVDAKGAARSHPGFRGIGERASGQGSRLAGGDLAAAPAFYLLDVAGAAESEGPADDVIVVKSQQAQQLTKDLVKIIAAHGFSALRKRHARVPGRRGSIADRRAHAQRCAIRKDRPVTGGNGSTSARCTPSVDGSPLLNHCFRAPSTDIQY